MKTQEIPIKDIKVVENHRGNISDTHLDELMQSIKQHGLKQPIGVMPAGRGKYNLIFGHRRLLACEKLGLTTIDATITEGVDDKKFVILNLTENMQRNDPTFAELGRAIEKLEKMKMTFPEMAVRLGKPEKELQKIYRTYKCLPEKHRKNVQFMGKGNTNRNGGIPHTMATHIAMIKRSRGLTEEAVDSLIEHVKTSDINKDGLTNLAIMLDQGLKLDDAIKKMEHYHVFYFDIVAPKSLIIRLMEEFKCSSANELLKKIIYGEAPGLPKPEFMKNKK